MIALTLHLLNGSGPLPVEDNTAWAMRIVRALALTGDARQCSGFAHDPNPATAASLLNSERIRSAIVQTLCHMIDGGLSLSEAVNAPRVHVEGGHTSVEGGFPETVVATVRSHYPDADIWPDQSFFFGGVHAVRIGSDGAAAAGDPRRGGYAVLI